MDNNHLEKVYSEASQWVRVTNQVVWSLGAIFVPASMAAIWLALTTTASRVGLAAASLLLFVFWIVICEIYARSAHIARETLIEIEKQWKLDKRYSFYENQSKITAGFWRVNRLRFLFLILIIITWLYIIFIVPPTPAS